MVLSEALAVGSVALVEPLDPEVSTDAVAFGTFVRSARSKGAGHEVHNVTLVHVAHTGLQA